MSRTSHDPDRTGRRAYRRPPMNYFDRIAEQRIAEAQARGELSDLSAAGRPLIFDDDSFVPLDLRAAYRVLKNAGYLPPELEMRREIVTLERLLDFVMEADERANVLRRIALLKTQIGQSPVRSAGTRRRSSQGGRHSP